MQSKTKLTYFIPRNIHQYSSESEEQYYASHHAFFLKGLLKNFNTKVQNVANKLILFVELYSSNSKRAVLFIIHSRKVFSHL